MSKFEYKDEESKASLKRRALLLKPNLDYLLATKDGWEVRRPNGTLELLVSFKGLNELIADETIELYEPTLVEDKYLETEDKIESVLEFSDSILEKNEPEEKEEILETEKDVKSEVVVKKKSGRPAKVNNENS